MVNHSRRFLLAKLFITAGKHFCIRLISKFLSLKFNLKIIDKSTKTIDESNFYYICKDSNPLNSKMKTLNDFSFNAKRAIIRVDFNVPLDENFRVTDDTRIEAAKPTIDKILTDGGSVILMSHLGRPKGKEDQYALRHIVAKASEVLGVQVQFASDCRGEVAQNAAR